MTQIHLMFLAVGAAGGLLCAGLVVWLVMRARVAVLRSQLDAQTNQHAQLSGLFQNIATQTLQQNQDLFMNAAAEQLDKTKQSHAAALNSSVQSMEAMLTPMRQQVTVLGQQVQELEVKREGAYRQLLQNLMQQQQIQEQLRGETAELRRLMKHPAERGRWSDVQLQNIFRMSGMEPHVGDYTAQASFTTEQGTLRPDYIVHLPGDKHIVIDVKSPFDHYYKAETNDNPDMINGALRDHAKSIRDHVHALSRKEYGRAVQGSPEFVILFMHAEHLVVAALRVDKDLIQYALEHRVVIATPTTLFALLSALAYGWQQANVTENARQIALLGKELYESFAPFVDHWNNLGASLNKAVLVYNKTIASLQNRILAKARGLKGLGVSVGEALPEVREIPEVAQHVQIPELMASDDTMAEPAEIVPVMKKAMTGS
ncbi:MAG: DNA recombination protein RmuC [Alphaproteobacteria bacterium]